MSRAHQRKLARDCTVEFALALMRRARDIVGLATAALSKDERELLIRDLPSVADRFRETIVLHEDEDKERSRAADR